MRSRTYIATPPGATIREQLADRNMSQKEFASRMNMSEKHISKLINGDIQLTPNVALRLEMVLGLPAHFWSNLESIYRDKLEKAKAENEMEQDAEILKNLPYREMAKNGWVKDSKDVKERIYCLRQYFELVSLDLLQQPLISGIFCRKLNEGEKSDYALLAWAQKAKLEARELSVSPVNIDKLKKLLPSFRSMTRQTPSVFCAELSDALAECGIALIFLPHIGGSFLHGATFFDGPKIVIGMTVRGKDADRFWFSLFHEFGHIILGHIGKLTGADAADENAADAFAEEALIPAEELHRFTNAGNFDKASVLSFAEEIGIDPGIVVGRLQKERFIPYYRWNDLKTRYELPA